MLVEQAIFGSGRSQRAEGYHLVGRSPGLAEADARELVAWAPSHDALSSSASGATSCNFVALASGNVCISKTMAVGSEYSGRGGAQVYTQCLIVPPVVFERFANNPFAIVRAASASGELAPRDRPRSELEPLRLVGRAAAVDQLLLAQLALQPGAKALAALVHCVLNNERVIVVGSQGETLLAGLFSTLPVAERGQYSFTTGLKLSPLRATRLAAVPELCAEVQRFARQAGAAIFQPHAIGEVDLSADRWAQLVERSLGENKYQTLTAEVVRQAQSTGTTPPAAAHMVAAAPPAAPLPSLRGQAFSRRSVVDAVEGLYVGSQDEPVRPERDKLRGAAKPRETAPTARCDMAAATDLAIASETSKPAERWRQDPETIAVLERLDDLVFDAIDAEPHAFDELVEYWPRAMEQIGPGPISESLEQYLRHALAVWHSQDESGQPDSRRIMAAIDVLCLLFPEEF